MVFGLAGLALADDPRGVALVIGNGAYRHTENLPGAPKDARRMAEAFEALGYQVVHVQDATEDEMFRAVERFREALDGAPVGVVYYAGHGIQVDGANYLVPVDARLTTREMVGAETVPISFIQGTMGAARAPVNVLILDACRVNPFAHQWTSTTRATSAPGLASPSAAQGFFVGYATEPGMEAADTANGVGPYAESLSRHILTPGESIFDVFGAVNADVLRATDGKQRPWLSSSLQQDFSFLPAPTEDAPAPRTVEPTPRKTVGASWYVATGTGISAGGKIELVGVTEPAGKIHLALETGMDILGPSWFSRWAFHVDPILNGELVSATNDPSRVGVTPAWFGLAVQGGWRGELWGQPLAIGGLTGIWLPGRVPLRVTARRTLVQGLGAEVRVGLNVATAHRVELGADLLLSWDVRWRQP